MLKNTKNHYGWPTIALHWLLAASFFFLFGLGIYMVELTYYDSWYKGSFDLHKSVGMIVILVFLLRIVWRVINIHPAPIPGPRWEQLSAKGMHFLLYAVPFLALISGYLISAADGRPIAIFDWITIPTTPPFIEQQEDIAGLIHKYLAWALIALASFHGLAALKHHFLNKDNTLLRMIKSQR